VGSPSSLTLLDAEAATIDVTVPLIEEHGIASYFNRAVVSSQAFSKQFPSIDTDDRRRAAEAWLANGLENAVPNFLDRSAGRNISGAIYHLTGAGWGCRVARFRQRPAPPVMEKAPPRHGLPSGRLALVTCR
jgi:hypothetical protein